MGACVSSPSTKKASEELGTQGGAPTPRTPGKGKSVAAELSGAGEGGFNKIAGGRDGPQVRILLIGPGESGKSTFFKQLKIIQGEGISEQERRRWIPAIHLNLRSQMAILLQHAKAEDVELQSPEAKEAFEKFVALPESSSWSEELGNLIKILWQDSGIKVVYTERDRLFSLNDGAGYFFNSIDRIRAADYVPTQQDLLCVRIRSVTFEQAVYTYKNLTFKVWDIGGQIPERKKWRRHISASTAILFFASLTEYDQKMREDDTKVRMQDTLDLFEEICFLAETQKKPLILMLNKVDLFKEKIKRRKLKSFFPDYNGSQDWEEAAEYIKKQYLRLLNGRECYPHYTTAIDTPAVEQLWKTTRDILSEKALDTSVSGMMM